MKSVGQKTIAALSGASHWPAAKYPRKSVSNPISKNALRFIREIRCKFCPTDFTDIHRFFLGRFFSHADFADDADFYSSDDTEFIRRFLAAAITHGFSRRRPVRSLQIPPEIGQSDSIKKSVEICEICGTKKLPRKKSASSAKSA